MDKNRNQYIILLIAFAARSTATYTFLMTATLVLQKFQIGSGMIAAAFSVMPLASLILDVPTGAFADSFSNKMSVIIAGVLDLFSISSFIFAPQISALCFLGFFLKGAGTAFESGALRILILDKAVTSVGSTSSGRSLSARDVLLVQRLASLGGVGAAFVLLNFSPYYPLFLALSCTILFLVLMLFVEDAAQRARRFTSVTAGIEQIRTGISFVSKAHAWPLLLYFVLEGVRMGMDNPIFFPLVRDILGGETLLWTFAIVSFVIRTPASWLVHRLNFSTPQFEKAASFAFTAVGISCTLLAVLQNPTAVYVFVSLNFLFYTIRDFSADNWQLQYFESHHLPRSTVLSSLNFCQNLFAFIGGQIVAFMGFLANPVKGYTWMGPILVVGSLVIYLLQRRQKAFAPARN